MSARVAATSANAPTLITTRQFASAALASARSGKSTSGSASTSTSASMPPSAAARRMPVGVEAAQLGDRAPRGGEVLVPGIERDPAGQEARREAEVERAVDVGARQGAEEAHARDRGELRRGVDGRVGRLGDGSRGRARRRPDPSRPSRLAADVVDGVQAGGLAGERTRERRGRCALLTREVAQHRGRVLREAVVARRHVDQRDVEIDGRAPHAQVQDRQLLLEVRTRPGRSPSPGRGRRSWPGAGRGRPRPGARRPAARPRCPCAARPSRSAPTRRRPRWCRWRHRAPRSRSVRRTPRTLRSAVGRGVERLRPGRVDEVGVVPDAGRVHAGVGVDVLVAVAALVAQPALVHGLRVDAEQPHQAVGRRLERAPAADRARLAGRLDGREVPRPGLEPVRPGGQRAHRADLDDVPREVGGERLVGVGDDLGRVAAAAEVDERIAGDLGREAGAAATLDATLTVEEHEVR